MLATKTAYDADDDIDRVVRLIRGEAGRVVLAVGAWRTMVDLYADLLAPIAEWRVAESKPVQPANGQDATVGYFELPERLRSVAYLERLLISRQIGMYVAEPASGFLESIPTSVVWHLNSVHDWPESLLSAVSQLRGYKWLALSDGNPGDQLYYHFAAAG